MLRIDRQIEQNYSPIVVASVLWAIGIIGALWLIASAVVPLSSNSKLYLIPWVFATAIAVCLPSLYLFHKGRFHLFHPLVFPAWTYFIPGYIVGGFILAFGYAQPYYLAYIGDETYALPLTFVYLIVGFLSLAAGFAIPFAGRIGQALSQYLPSRNISDGKAIPAGFILLFIGGFNIVVALSYGAFGYQVPEEGMDFVGTIRVLTLFWYQGSFIVALSIFRRQDATLRHYAILAFVVMLAIAGAMTGGGRAGLVHMLLPILAAFLYSGKKVTLKGYALIGSILTILLVIGVIYGTTFRIVKGSQEAASIEDYLAVIPQTIDVLGDKSFDDIASQSFETLAARLELVSSLAVVVSNYEALQTLEEQYGISNNILTESFTFFIPRIIWKDKPIPIEPAKYAELYFNLPTNAFTLTPIGDLLRNFGPLGIPIGMFILGLILRFGYGAFVEGQAFSYWKISTYYLLLTTLSYDASFSLAIPHMVKVFFTSLIGLLIVTLLVGRNTDRSSEILKA